MVQFPSFINFIASRAAGLSPGLAATAPVPSLTRAPATASLFLAASVGLAALLGGCGRTGLLTDEGSPAETTDGGVSDAGTGGTGSTDGGATDAGLPDAGTDGGTTPVTPVSDLDCDGVLDLLDNCLLSGNGNQNDTDHDGMGDVCDIDSVNPDVDGDGILDGEEVWILGSDPFASDTDGDGVADGTDACPTTAGPAASAGCLPEPPACELQAIPQPETLCDGTFVEGFRLLWTTGNAADVTLTEEDALLTRKHSGQIYVYPMTNTLYVLTAESPFGNCVDSVVVNP